MLIRPSRCTNENAAFMETTVLKGVLGINVQSPLHLVREFENMASLHEETSISARQGAGSDKYNSGKLDSEPAGGSSGGD